jgi:hypothetical protein
MVQRIQSLYLLLTTIFSVLFLSGNFLKFTENINNLIFINLGGIKRISEAGGATEHLDKLLPLAGLLLLIPLVSFLAIFLFKKRKLQLTFSITLIILILLLIFSITFYSLYIIRNYNAEIIPGYKLILPVFMLICAFLAFRGIKKDVDLIKSYDRLR